MDTNYNADLLIVGAGPAGLTAAIYGIRYGLSVLIFENEAAGGQVATTPEVENYPAIDRITGFELAMKLRDQAVSLGAVIKSEGVINLFGHSVETKKSSYFGKAVIIANGAKRRLLGCDGEARLTGKGVSYCATCDGTFFKGKNVAIIGGGNTALEDALFLAKHCNKVCLIHRGEKFRAMPPLIDAVTSCPNLTVLYNTTVSGIVGEDRVSAIITNGAAGCRALPVQGVFIAIGTVPDNEQFLALALDSKGYITANEDCQTNLLGVFAAGDTRTKLLRQIVTATADGAVAAFMAANYINLSR